MIYRTAIAACAWLFLATVATAADNVVTTLAATIADIEAALGEAQHPRLGLEKIAGRLNQAAI